MKTMADADILETLADLKEQITRMEERIIAEREEERMIAEREYRTLGHRMVWNEEGRCNVPAMPILSGEALKKQLERQKKYY